MQFVACKELKEGMCVAVDVLDNYGRTLIARGQVIGSHHIVRMRKFGIDAIFIDPNNGDAVEMPTRSELRDRCMEVLSTSFSSLAKEMNVKRVKLDAQAIQDVTNQLVEALMQSRNPLVTLLDVSTSSDKMMQHAVNTAVLSTVLALDMYVPDAMVRNLAVAMLFHDIGTIFLPEELLYKPGRLADDEVKILRQHVHMSCNHLVHTNAVSNVAANIVLCHHETMDGSGYPTGANCEKLNAAMRIAQVVEVYDTLTTGRSWMPAVLPDVAISYLISNAGRLFAKEAVIALCQRIALYPKGTAVLLNSGEAGVVAGTLPKAPTRPVVLVHQDNRGKPLRDPLIVDLMTDLRRAVVRSAPNMQMLLEPKEPAAPLRPVDPILASLG